MEEVDKILILSLNHLGCEIDENEVSSVGGLDVNGVVGGVVRCVKAINPDCDLPSSLPHNMAQRFRVAAAVAQAVKDVGYPGDVGYQSLLYPNETDIRKIFMFLIEKLPKDTAVVSDEPLNRASLVHREAKRKVSEALGRPWLPAHCCRVLRSHASHPSPVTHYGTHHIQPFSSAHFKFPPHPANVPPESREYYEHHLRRVTSVVGVSRMIATLLNTHAAQLQTSTVLPPTTTKESEERIQLETIYSISSDMRAEEKVERKTEGTTETSIAPQPSHLALSPFLAATQMVDVKESDKTAMEASSAPVQSEKKTTEEEVRARREEQITALQNDIDTISKKISECTEGIKETESTLVKMSEQIEQEEQQRQQQVADLKVKQKTSSLLPESQANLQRLKAGQKNSEEKMVRLQRQWEEHRRPLSEHLTQLSLQLNNGKTKKEESVTELSLLRDKMRAMVQDAARKETALAQLKAQVERMNKDINRSVYTKRIADISAKVRKQKREIERVLSDTRSIQKEINNLSGKLERTFTVVEGTAYKEAGSKEKVRAVYRAVAGVHEGCSQLVDIIRETGAIQREIADLREQVDLEKSKKVEETLEQLKVDLIQVKKENALLKEQLL
ncbi:hypothetical protein Pcinc_014557 [Petrolisthes cinctipes]|uniref:Coiled-coil domain-containing protein 22 homolog n=1 Tax=Petrolisthes cinctipes TaxID=88211 RepID=A0AAE1FWR8_PETCI|nr:hypothetical protein Pcinc_014557 [Petrolisthes cinctipes]